MTTANEFDTEAMLEYWRWLVPPAVTPLFISVIQSPEGLIRLAGGALHCRMALIAKA